jgi:hypothetical protein
MVLNATFNNISAISWRSVVLEEEAKVPGENHRPAVNVLGVPSQDSEMSCICVLGVPSQDSEMSCICVLRVSIMTLSTIFYHLTVLT